MIPSRSCEFHASIHSSASRRASAWVSGAAVTARLRARGSQRGRDGNRWAALLAPTLVGVDRVALLERHRDVVEPPEQPVADLMVDLEGDLATGEADLLLAQVDLPVGRPSERATILLGEHYLQHPDLGAVGVEDVGDRGCDDRLEAVVLQPPWCMLARGSAAEVLAGDEDRVGRQVPVGLLRPIVETG